MVALLSHCWMRAATVMIGISSSMSKASDCSVGSRDNASGACGVILAR